MLVWPQLRVIWFCTELRLKILTDLVYKNVESVKCIRVSDWY